MQKLTTFLMFDGRAEEAMTFYSDLFNNSQIVDLSRYGPEDQAMEGKIRQATLSIHGHEFKFIDSPITHPFSFTPAISIFVQCQTEEEIERLFSSFSSEGQILMPLGAYPFSKKFGWVNDKFGISWQLSLPA